MSNISVIIPSYNQAQYLPDCIESVLNQTVKPREIIVVDDGSTDGSLEIAKKYPIKVVSQVNKGLASARNTGIMNAHGVYIFPLDSDDILVPNAIEVLEKAIETTNADIIAPSFKTFGVENTQVVLGQGLTLRHFRDANYVGYFCAIRRSKLLEIGGYSPRMVWGYEDYHCTVDLLKRGAQLVVLPDILVLYRTKENSMIHTAQKHHNELIAQIAKDHPQLYAD